MSVAPFLPDQVSWVLLPRARLVLYSSSGGSSASLGAWCVQVTGTPFFSHLQLTAAERHRPQARGAQAADAAGCTAHGARTTVTREGESNNQDQSGSRLHTFGSPPTTVYALPTYFLPSLPFFSLHARRARVPRCRGAWGSSRDDRSGSPHRATTPHRATRCDISSLSGPGHSPAHRTFPFTST